MEQLTLGVCGTSRKENEHRLPIHPLHLDRIEAGLRARIFLERGYGERFGVADAQLAPLVAGVRSRQQLIAECEVIVLPKPTEGDVAGLREGQVLWGWPHCVQDYAVTQLSIGGLSVLPSESWVHSQWWFWNMSRTYAPMRYSLSIRLGRPVSRTTKSAIAIPVRRAMASRPPGHSAGWSVTLVLGTSVRRLRSKVGA